MYCAVFAWLLGCLSAVDSLDRVMQRRRIQKLKQCALVRLVALGRSLPKGALKTKYKFVSLKRLLFPDNNNTNFTASVK